MSENVFQGNVHTDHRGSLIFFNHLNLCDVKRMYILEHKVTNVVRAWQGHKLEQKWFFATQGIFKMVLVKLSDWTDPPECLPYIEYKLSESIPTVLHVPGGYATGIQALEPESKLMVFSDRTLSESAEDDFRFEKDRWYPWNP